MVGSCTLSPTTWSRLSWKAPAHPVFIIAAVTTAGSSDIGAAHPWEHQYLCPSSVTKSRGVSSPVILPKHVLSQPDIIYSSLLFDEKSKKREISPVRKLKLGHYSEWCNKTRPHALWVHSEQTLLDPKQKGGGWWLGTCCSAQLLSPWFIISQLCEVVF